VSHASPGKLTYLPIVASAQWRDKGERLYMPTEHAAYLPKPEYKRQQKDTPDSTAPRYDNPLTRHQLSYLNGGGGSGKTTRAIELFQLRDPLVFFAKFCRNRSNCSRDIAIFRFIKMATAAILDFQNFTFLTVRRLKRSERRRYTKFSVNRSNRCRDRAIFRFF